MLPKNLTILALRLTNGRFIEVTKLSIFDRVDYLYYLKRLYQYLQEQPSEPIPDLYLNHSEFRHLVDKCLEFHGIPGKYLEPGQLVELLFASKAYPYGLLNQFNFNFEDCPTPGTKPDTKGSLLAKLYKSIGNLEEAMSLAKDLPSDVLEDFMQEMAPPEKAQKDSTLEYLKKNGVPLPGKDRADKTL